MTENTKRLRGLGTALVTPFEASGAVDYKALQALVERQIAGGVDYIVVLGTTGEAVTLSEEERREVRQFIARQVAGRVPLVLGAGGNCTQSVIAHIREVNDELRRDYAAILSVCPYYNKPSQEGLYRHFSAIAEVSSVPIILYNVPGRTGVNMLPETALRLHEAYPDRIIGIKEASGKVEQIKKLINEQFQISYPNGTIISNFKFQNNKFLIISGDDGIACELMEAGADGLISVASNAWPEDFGRIVREKDATLQAKYSEMIELLFKEGNPSGVKTVLSQMGLIGNHLRLPLVPNSEAVQREIARAIEALQQ